MQEKEEMYMENKPSNPNELSALYKQTKQTNEQKKNPGPMAL